MGKPHGCVSGNAIDGGFWQARMIQCREDEDAVSHLNVNGERERLALEVTHEGG